MVVVVAETARLGGGGGGIARLGSGRRQLGRAGSWGVKGPRMSPRGG